MHAETVASEWLLFGVKQVVFGPLAGIVGRLCGRETRGLLSHAMDVGGCRRHDRLRPGLRRIRTGRGRRGQWLQAAFVVGTDIFGNTLKQKCLFLYEFAESEEILVLLTFTAFGAAMIPQAIDAVRSITFFSLSWR